MSTLADELLQDFEDSGSENGDLQNDNGPDPDDGPALPDGDHRENDTMMMDDDDAEDPDGDEDDGDEDMGGVDGIVNAMEDAEAAKARVEKMQLGNIKDVRKVTSVMDRLEPLLKT
ncbi:putative prp31 c terminal domain-containing protein [Rosellinia necatrix]|uniref:Putative prp31 c terminal domain-containing protein n=1 Tax=Rosellinia necatrix TaxID=77044 RepID=A0A1S8ABZ5_ROSNE|nr:putative prp31 c terminal domain-containing protein [Rosellinia necatrix]